MELLRASWYSRNSLAFHPSNFFSRSITFAVGLLAFDPSYWSSCQEKEGANPEKATSTGSEVTCLTSGLCTTLKQVGEMALISNKGKWATSAGLMSSRESGNFKFLIAVTR